MLLRDLRHALRVIGKSPASSWVAVLTMAIGIGATTGVFSLLNAVLFHPFPYQDVGRLVYVWTPNPKIEGAPHEIGPSTPDFYEWNRTSHSFDSMAQFQARTFKLGADRVPGARVTADFFRVLGVKPAMGRTIAAADDERGRRHVAVISDGLWRGRFGGRPDVLRQTLDIDGERFEIIGVMPPAFQFPLAADAPPDAIGVERSDLWIPAAFTDKQKTSRVPSDVWEDGVVIARLRPGVTVAQAKSELSSLEEGLQSLYPEMFRGWQVDVQLLAEAASGYVRRPMWLMFGAVLAVLLISCGNVAGLLIARAAARGHEMGVRAALGASRARLIWQMQTESLVLAIAGGGLGVAVAAGLVRLVLAWNPGDIPRLQEASVDWRVLCFTVAVTAGSGVLFGFAPAWLSARVNLVDLMKSCGGSGGGKGAVYSSGRLGQALIVAQVAITVVLLSGAGLLLRSYAKLASLDKGYAPSTMTARIGLAEDYDQPGKEWEFTSRLLADVRALPGVQAAGAVTSLPLSKSLAVTMLNIKGYAGEAPQAADNYSVTPGYFEAMRIRVLAGRALDAKDFGSESRDQQNVVVNQAFANRFFSGREVIGGLLRPADQPKTPWWRIVGIVADVRHADLESVPRPTIYLAFNRDISGRKVFLATRGAGNFAVALPAIVKKHDPTASVALATMDQRIDEANRSRRFQTAILTGFAASALALALVGLYGIMAYSVRRRTAEIGIRMALGATRAGIARMVVGRGLLLVLGGLAAGLAGAAAVSNVIASMLFGISSTDPATFAAVPALLIIVGVAACALPARRAASVEPVEALRDE